MLTVSLLNWMISPTSCLDPTRTCTGAASSAVPPTSSISPRAWQKSSAGDENIPARTSVRHSCSPRRQLRQADPLTVNAGIWRGLLSSSRTRPRNLVDGALVALAVGEVSYSCRSHVGGVRPWTRATTALVGKVARAGAWHFLDVPTQQGERAVELSQQKWCSGGCAGFVWHSFYPLCLIGVGFGAQGATREHRSNPASCTTRVIHLTPRG